MMVRDPNFGKPLTDRVRVCSQHQDRKATNLRVTMAHKPLPHTTYRPECAECASKPMRNGKLFKDLRINKL